MGTSTLSRTHKNMSPDFLVLLHLHCPENEKSFLPAPSPSFQQGPPKCFQVFAKDTFMKPVFICISRAQWQELSFLWILVSFWDSQASSSSSVKVFFMTSQSISTEELLQDTAYRSVISALKVCELVICIQDFLKLYNVNPEKKKIPCFLLLSPIIHFIFSKPLFPFLIYKCW